MSKLEDSVVLSVSLLNEIWKEIPGFSKYLASDKGRVFTKPRNAVANQYEVETTVGTYLRTSAVSDDGKCRSKEVHHLVALAFLGPPPSDGRQYEVNHKDGNKHHNASTNLEWMTRSENLKHAYSSGLRSDNQPLRVIDHELGKVLEFNTVADLARAWSIHPKLMNNIISQCRTKHYLDRYEFDLDYTAKKSTKHKWIRDLVAKDYSTGQILIASDSRILEGLTKVHRMTILYNVRNGSLKLVGGYVFQVWGPEIKWPEYSTVEVEASKINYFK